MKRALVTGGTKGIGLAVVKMLLKDGYYVTVTYGHDEKSASDFAGLFSNVSNRFEIMKIDQGSKADMKALASHILQHGSLNCLVCNAGITLRKGITDFTDEEWEHVMQVNVNAPVFLLRDLFHSLSNDARIVFIGSEMGIYPHGTSLAYGVTKSAIHSLAKNLIKFFEGTEITVNAIAPGFVETEWQKNKPVDIRKSICDKTALKRFATTEEIADAVRFCLNNAFVNGSIIEVNGGYCFK